MENIKQAKELLDAGIITLEEFNEVKQTVLSQLKNPINPRGKPKNPLRLKNTQVLPQSQLDEHIEKLIVPESPLLANLSVGINRLDELNPTENEKQLWYLIRNQFDLALYRSSHEFSLDSVQIIHYPENVERFLSTADFEDHNLKLLYHGTFEEHIENIAKTGFDDSRIGTSSDAGWFGRGHYFTPQLGYAVAYCGDQKKKNSLRRLNFDDALDVATTVRVLVCLVLCGKQLQLKNKCMGERIEDYDSHKIWVDGKGEPLDHDMGNHCAMEVVVPRSCQILPRLIFSITRVNQLIMWKDPNIFNAENSAITLEINSCYKSIRLFVTNEEDAYKRLISMAKKPNITYRLVTSGTNGKEFCDWVRKKNFDYPVLVFCMNVEYHQKWAQEFENVIVTNDKALFERFVVGNARKEERKSYSYGK